MNITVSTKIDLNAVKALCYASVFKKKNPTVCMIVYVAVMLVLIAASVALGIYTGDPELSSLPTLFFMALVIVVFLYFRIPVITHKQMGSGAEAENHYVFAEKGFYIRSEGNGTRGESEFNYDSLEKIMETGKYFLIFINKAQAYIVNRSCFANGDEDVLKANLKEKLGKNYIVCKY